MHVATKLLAGTRNTKYIPFPFNLKLKQNPKQSIEPIFGTTVLVRTHNAAIYSSESESCLFIKSGLN